MIKLNKPFGLGELGQHTPNGSFDYSLWYSFIKYIEKFLLIIFFRPIAIQNHFNLVSYFMTWDGMHSPIREKNATALYDNPHVVNRDQI